MAIPLTVPQAGFDLPRSITDRVPVVTPAAWGQVLLADAAFGAQLADRIWAVEEIAREMRDPIAATDGLNRLTAAGLVHRIDSFVFASRAAARASELAMA